MAEVGRQPQPMNAVELTAEFVELCTVMRDLRDAPAGRDGGPIEVPYPGRLLTGLMHLARPGAEVPETTSDEELRRMLNVAYFWGFEKGIVVLFDRVAQKGTRYS